MVALSPRCCAELGIPLSEEDRKRPYVEVSGRKGLGVKADDLMDSLIAKALEEVASRHPDDPPEKNRTVATQIAIARAALLPAEVHAQYGDRLRSSGGAELRRRDRAVRAIRGGARAQHSAQAGGARRAASRFRRANSTPEAMARQLAVRRFLADAAGRLEGGFARWRARSHAGEPAHVARYAFQLAQAFNNFYQKYPIIHEQDREKKVFLLWMTDFFRRQLERTGGDPGDSDPRVHVAYDLPPAISCSASKEIAQATLDPS